jgi:hypothetical protein
MSPFNEGEKGGDLSPFTEDKGRQDEHERAANETLKGGKSNISPYTEPTTNQNIKHTHTAPPRAPESKADRPCVCDPDLTFDDYRSFARSRPSIKEPDAWASVHFDKRDRDQLVREHKENTSPEKILESRSAPNNKNLFYGEACDMVRTMVEIGRDPQAVIDDMPLDDETRARLVRKFVTNSETVST